MTIAIMGILLAIGIIVWLGLLEQRRVDAAARQFAADLRLAHTSATNQLTDWRVIYRLGQPEYHLVRLSQVCPETACSNPRAVEVIRRELPEKTAVVESSNGADGVVSRFNLYNATAAALLPTTVNQPGSTSSIEFNPDGGSYAYSGPISGLKVGSVSNPTRCYKFTVLAATSRVNYAKVDGCN